MNILKNKLINKKKFKNSEKFIKPKLLDNIFLNKKILSNSISLNNNLYRLSELAESFNYLNINIASPLQIKKWSPNGKISKEIRIMDKFHASSFFSERIFGPLKDWSCKCLKYKMSNKDFTNKITSKIVCPICKVQITSSQVRRYNMSYIELSCPVIHTWYRDNIPNYLDLFLKLAYKNQILSKVWPLNIEWVHNKKKIVPFILKHLRISRLMKSLAKYTTIPFQTVGPELIRDLLHQLDIKTLVQNLRYKILETFDQNLLLSKSTLIHLRILENFLATKTRPEWMILTRIPVLPPTLRPFFKIQNDYILFAPLNTFYNQIYLSNRDYIQTAKQRSFYKFFQTNKLQLSVDRLFDNNHLIEVLQLSANNKPLTSLTEGLKGKYGRFRYNLLGKRVNFSARSVIVVEPSLQLHQCGLPFQIALKLFEPYLLNIFLSKYSKIYGAKNVDINESIKFLLGEFLNPSLLIYKILKKMLVNYSIFLNRAPTLHRFGIQSFNPILISSRAITLHPLVCTGFNADFDGDQMAVHLPLYKGSQIEAYISMSPANNILTPANGETILKPSQDIVIGSCYLSLLNYKHKNLFFKYFIKNDDVIDAYLQKHINLHTPILIQAEIKDIFIERKNKNLILKSNFLIANNISIEIFKYIINSRYLYFFTNLGILVAQKNKNSLYKIIQFFIKTTPGRIIFTQNLKKIKL